MKLVKLYSKSFVKLDFSKVPPILRDSYVCLVIGGTCHNRRSSELNHCKQRGFKAFFLFYLKSVRGMKVRILIFKWGFNIASDGER